jgi:hypothetical protein
MDAVSHSGGMPIVEAERIGTARRNDAPAAASAPAR